VNARRRPRAPAMAGLAALAAFASTQARAESVTVQFTPAADNSLYQESGELSNGAGGGIFVGRIATGLRRRALVRFDLASIPANAVVQSATLDVTVTRTISDNVTVGLHRVAAAWGEAASDAGPSGGTGAQALAGDATWTLRVFPGTPWLTAGGDFASAASQTAALGGFGTFRFESNAALVADVQSFVAAPALNFGWLLLADESASPPSAKRLGSRESSDPATRPTLVVTYDAPIVPPPMVAIPVPIRWTWPGSAFAALGVLALAWSVGRLR